MSTGQVELAPGGVIRPCPTTCKFDLDRDAELCLSACRLGSVERIDRDHGALQLWGIESKLPGLDNDGLEVDPDHIVVYL